MLYHTKWTCVQETHEPAVCQNMTCDTGFQILIYPFYNILKFSKWTVWIRYYINIYPKNGLNLLYFTS